MNVLFNDNVLKHNIDDKYDGVYRLQNFIGKYANTNIDFDVLPYIEKVHSKEYIASVINECKINGGLASVNLTPGSYDALIMSVGLSILASKQGDFALTRPPGHHAHKNYGAGFCIYNNIAIACKHLLSEGKRVAVLDLDGHRGDGTQDILKDENNFFHCSLHQKNAYPGPGEFYSNNAINIALENPVERGDYLIALDKAINYINEFEPDVVGISMGFDTYKEDRSLNFLLDIDDYSYIGNRLTNIEIPKQSIFAVLEGGYHNKVLECTESFIRGFNVS